MPLRESSQENVAIVQRNILLKSLSLPVLLNLLSVTGRKEILFHCHLETVSRAFP